MKKTIGFAALTLGLLAGCSTTPYPDNPESNADTQLIAADGKAKLIAADGQPIIADDGASGDWSAGPTTPVSSTP